jgi:hypothetical protein
VDTLRSKWRWLVLVAPVAAMSSGCLPPLYIAIEHEWESRAYSTHILEREELTQAQWYYEVKTIIRHVSDFDETLNVLSVELKNVQSTPGYDFFKPGLQYPEWGIISIADNTAFNTFQYFALFGTELNVEPNCHQELPEYCSSADEIIIANHTVGWEGGNGPNVHIPIYGIGVPNQIGLADDDVFYYPN